MATKNWVTGVLAGTALCGLALTACGDKGGASASSTTATASTAATNSATQGNSSKVTTQETSASPKPSASASPPASASASAGAESKTPKADGPKTAPQPKGDKPEPKKDAKAELNNKKAPGEAVAKNEQWVAIPGTTGELMIPKDWKSATSGDWLVVASPDSTAGMAVTTYAQNADPTELLGHAAQAANMFDCAWQPLQEATVNEMPAHVADGVCLDQDGNWNYVTEVMIHGEDINVFALAGYDQNAPESAQKTLVDSILSVRKKKAGSDTGDDKGGASWPKECQDAEAAIKACKGPAAQAGRAAWTQGLDAVRDVVKANADGPGASAALDAGKQACKALVDALKAACD